MLCVCRADAVARDGELALVAGWPWGGRMLAADAVQQSLDFGGTVESPG